MNKALAAILLFASCGARAAELVRYAPASNAFSCDIPADWTAFEENEPAGTAVHIFGPESASGAYRAGLDIRYAERGQPGFRSFKKIIEDLRRQGGGREATAVRAFKIPSSLARVFEVSESLRLPPGASPSLEETVHDYIAVVPAGESYYVIRLSSTREVYLDYKDFFFNFLKTFRPT